MFVTAVCILFLLQLLYQQSNDIVFHFLQVFRKHLYHSIINNKPPCLSFQFKVQCFEKRI